MRYEDFLNMSMEQMADTVWSDGVFLTKRKFPTKSVELYAMNNFFVEIWFTLPQNIRDFHFVLLIKSFKGIKGLDPYLFNKKSFQFVKMIDSSYN